MMAALTTEEAVHSVLQMSPKKRSKKARKMIAELEKMAHWENNPTRLDELNGYIALLRPSIMPDA